MLTVFITDGKLINNLIILINTLHKKKGASGRTGVINRPDLVY